MRIFRVGIAIILGIMAIVVAAVGAVLMITDLALYRLAIWLMEEP